MKNYDVVIVGAGPAGVGISSMLKDFGVENMIVLERGKIGETFDKWPVLSVRVIHRVGLLSPGDNIVFIGVGSEHRKISFDACEYIMDYLKTKAPFWKKEVTSNGERWVKAKVDDDVAVRNWESNS